jgi:hypothetical protein
MNDYITKAVDWAADHRKLVIGIAVLILLALIAAYNY